MKVLKTFCIDEDICERLKSIDNISKLINDQLRAHFDTKNCENKEILARKLTETKQILKENRKKKREIEDLINKIDKKTARIKQALRQKNITRSKLIKTIIERRNAEAMQPHSRTEYFITPEEEADIILKGGTV